MGKKSSQGKLNMKCSSDNSVYEQTLLSQVEVLCHKYNCWSKFPGMSQLTGLQVFPLQYPSRRTNPLPLHHFSPLREKLHSIGLFRETSVASLHHWHVLARMELLHEKTHIHHAETGPKRPKWLNFPTFPIPFTQGSQNHHTQLRPTQNRAQLGKQNPLSQTFGALLITADSFPYKWKNCHFQIITFHFSNSNGDAYSEEENLL